MELDKAERAALVALSSAEEALVSASIRGDTDAERDSRIAMAEARSAINAGRGRRLASAIAARLTDLAELADTTAAPGDPVEAAARGELTLPEAVEVVRRTPDRFLNSDEQMIFDANPNALRLIVVARRERRPVLDLVQEVERESVGGLYAARAGSPEEVHKLVALLREQGVLPAEPAS